MDAQMKVLYLRCISLARISPLPRGHYSRQSNVPKSQTQLSHPFLPRRHKGAEHKAYTIIRKELSSKHDNLFPTSNVVLIPRGNKNLKPKM